jgi:flagellar biosynthesis/type III secretory pathway ATPase
MKKKRKTEPIEPFGILPLNGLFNLRQGQAYSPFAGSGEGKKAFLLGMIARHTEADVKNRPYLASGGVGGQRV